MSNSPNSPTFVVAVGASAGGLEALQDFLAHLPGSLINVSIIIAQHLSPTHKSMLVQLLSRGTKMEVIEAVHGSTLEANKVYITPPDKEISFLDGAIHLKKPAFSAGPKPSVDVLFQSLAMEIKENVIAIILSGTGTDGSAGVGFVKRAGGFVIAQDPKSCKYDGMPSAAIETGDVDLIMSPNKMGEAIQDIIENPSKLLTKLDNELASSTTLDKIFKLLSKRTGTDFSNYKPSTICRRLEKRLNMLQLHTIDDYLPIVEKNPKELDIMFNMILIGVTAFFRDYLAFEALEKELNKLIETKGNKAPIRIWIPGCSTGEEAYSIAIILSKLLKDKPLLHNIQIFATDIDDRAIAFARRALYQENSLEDVPKQIIDTYFIKKGREYELAKSIRMMVLFSKHDVTKNPPFLKLDLISCRNLLIYFGANLQKQVLPIFHYALNPNGYLFLGKSETIGQFSDLFDIIDDKMKIYQRKAVGNIHGIKFSAFRTQKQDLPETHVTKLVKPASKNENTLSALIKDTLYTNFSYPYVVINEAFDIQEIYGDVRLYITFSTGLVNVNLLRMVNKELHIELRSVISKSIKEQTLIKSSIKKFELFDKTHYVRLSCLPLYYKDGANDLYLVIFEHLDLDELVTKSSFPNKELNEQSEKLQELEHELAATKEHLQTYIEELETSNEELQSLNEEMQSTNEELQSSNEELETSNEELQSTNEEIQIAYAELKAANTLLEQKERQLEENEANYNAMLSNELQGFILIDSGYNVLSFNNKAKDIFHDLSKKRLKAKASVIDYIDLSQVETFLTDFKKCLKGDFITKETTIKSHSGTPHSYIFNYSPVVHSKDSIAAVSLGIMETTLLKDALSKLYATQELLSSVFEATSIGICITDNKGNFVNMNNQYCKIYGYEKAELIGRSFTIMVPADNREYAQKLHDSFIETGIEIPTEWQVQHKNGTYIDIFVSAELLIQPDGSRLKITSIRDITEQNRHKNLLLQTQESGKIGGWEIDLASNEAFLTEEVYKILEEPNGAKISPTQLFNYFDKSTAEEVNLLLEETKQQGTEFSTSVECITANGKTKVLYITCKPVLLLSKVIRIFGTFQDITEQKTIEDNYRKLSRAAEQSSASIVITNLKGEIEYVNPAFTQTTGYSLKEAMGQNPRILKSGYTSSEEYQNMWQTLLEGKSWSGTFCNKKKNGELYWESASLSPVFDKSGIITHFLAVKENITQKKNAEKEREAIYKIISIINETYDIKQTFENVLKVISKHLHFVYAESWIVNINKTKLTYCKSYTINKLIYKSNESGLREPIQKGEGLLGQVWENAAIRYEKDRIDFPEFNNKIITSSFKSTLAIPILCNNELVAIFTFYSEAYLNDKDINSDFVKKLTIEIGGYLLKKKNEEELNKFFNLAPDMLCIADKDGYFKKINPSFEKTLGYTEEELLSVPYENFIHPDDQIASKNLHEEVVNGRKVYNFINRYLTKNGEIKWLSWNSTPTEEGLMYAVAADITAEYKLSEERKALISELLKNNQELKQFSYITSHNMRSPITNMLSIFQLLDLEPINNAEVKELFDALKQTTHHLNDTLNDLVKILIIKEDKDILLEQVKLEDVVNKVLSDIDYMLIDAKITCNFSACATINFNKSYLESILLNLITNAIKYAHPNRNPEIEVYTTLENGLVKLMVKDNGLGMNMDRVKDKIFGLHQRFHTKSNSTGIGLYIVKSQVEALGGKIEVVSTENVGTTFIVTLKPEI